MSGGHRSPARRWRKKSFQNPLTSPTICGIIKAWLREMKIRPNRKDYFTMAKRKILMLDTETANTFSGENGSLDTSNALVYDCGWQVIDTDGVVYEEASYVNRDVFIEMRDVMDSAYYADKIPNYWRDIWSKNRVVASTETIRTKMLECMVRHGIQIVCAHNARFDVGALNSTRRYFSKSAHRFWFPFGVEIWDTMKMAQDTICKMPTYKKFCEKNGYLCKNGAVRKTAEILYKFITKNNEFVEAHTGLEDVQIEKEILVYCFRQHKKMRKKLW